ncbi:MAG: MFS transporter [Promethearchaeota archaeon]
MNENSTFEESSKTRHSRWIFLSNALSQISSSTLSAVMSGFYLFYYEVIVGLNISLIFLASSIFVVYNAVNDPLFGFLIDRNMRFTKKWGRRFPWIVIGIIPWCFSIYLLFSIPDIDVSINPWPAFGWLLMSLFVYDTFGTLVGINVNTIRPDKFRTEGERRTFTKYYVPLDISSIVLGIVLPALFIDVIPGDKKASFQIMGTVVAIFCLIFAILSLPGNREDKIMIDRYFSPKTEKKSISFFKALKEIITSRSFVVYFIYGVTYGVSLALIIPNLMYVITFVLQESSDAYILILGLNLLGTLISVPFWLKFIKKINDNKKAFVVAGFTYSIALFPLTFFQGLFDLMIMAFILGLASGGINTFLFTILFPSVVDDFAVKTGTNQKAILIGISTMLNRLTSNIDELIFTIVHNLTGFVAGYDTYDKMAAVVSNMDLVLIGIRLLEGVIPGSILLAGILIFWKFFPLTQDVVLKNKAELERLGI